jgi:alkylation response protein AidB-like acyl-CoA dehydrogenase
VGYGVASGLAALDGLPLSGYLVGEMASSIAERVTLLSSALASREAADPERYPAESVALLFDAGVVAAPFPASLGGEGATLVEMVDATELCAAASASAALLLAMPVGLAGGLVAAVGLAPPEHRGAAMAQLERVAKDFQERRIYAACNSEKGAGGSLTAIRTVASSDPEGGYRITGQKILASFGDNADYFFSTARLEGGGVEFFVVPVKGEGVHVGSDWDGFGMRATESHAVRYENARATELVGYPGYIEIAQPQTYWFCLFAAVALGPVRSLLSLLGRPTPSSPALRARLSDALMRYESVRAYLRETAAAWRPGAPASYRARVVRAKTHVTLECARLAAELYALSGGRHYTRTSAAGRALADTFAAASLRPPLALAFDSMLEGFDLQAAFDPP